MNVLLISVDSLRYDALFGTSRDFSLPNIDALCERGTVCTNAFTNAPYTADSFTSILSGTHPWAYGTTTEGFESERPHLTEFFHDAGFQTFGLYSNPYLGPAFDYDRGWDRYAMGDEDESASMVGKLRQYVVQNVDRESPLFSLIHTAHRTLGERFGIELEGKPYPSAEKLTDKFVDWLEEADDEDPVFGWIHFMDVHSPFYPHEGTISEGMSQRKALQTFYGANQRPTAVTDGEREQLRRLYRGEIQYLDDSLGSLFEAVDHHLGLDETMILFVSDHGEAFDEHGFCFHPKQLYDELVHIPLVVDDPSVDIDRIDTPVSNIDVLPTLLSAANIDPPAECSGTAVHALPTEDQRTVFAQAIDQDVMKAMVTDGEWKLIRSMQANTEELYNRRYDSEEIDNRLDTDPGVAKRYRERLDSHLNTMRIDSKSGETTSREVSDEVNKRLQDLGYKP